MIQIGDYSVDDSRSNGRTQFKTKCPRCKDEGKKNVNDTCLSVNVSQKYYHCHKCGWKGYFGERTHEPEYKLPIMNYTDLTMEHLQSLTMRMITQPTAIRNGIKSARNGYIAFPYFEGETVVNIKYRHFSEKKFMQAADAKQTMYKFNDIVCQKEIIICEGEFDALSWEEAGILYATSVSQGAPNVTDASVDKKLACITNCFDVFEDCETIYLNVDNDPNGQRLQKELIRMFTAEKCKIISFDGLSKHNGEQCKDANDVLIAYGKEKLLECIKNAKDVKVEGAFECFDFYSEIMYDYQNGQPKGTTTYFSGVDPCWTHRMGEVTIWTGYNNEGKSLFLKQLLLLKSKYEGWKHAFYSPEEMPYNEWFTDVIESYIGLSADNSQKTYKNYMTPIQMEEGMRFMNEHFFVVMPKEDQTLDEVLRLFSYLIRKKGLQTVVIDPYNQVQHNLEGLREDLYISRFMAKLKRFAVEHNVAVHLVAHQTTPKFEAGKNYPEPNIYLIKGGGTFADKADNVCCVWRENRNTDQKDTSVKFISQKIKKQKLTGVPSSCVVNYDRFKNRYTENGVSPMERQPMKQGSVSFYEKEEDGEWPF